LSSCDPDIKALPEPEIYKIPACAFAEFGCNFLKNSVLESAP